MRPRFASKRGSKKTEPRGHMYNRLSSTALIHHPCSYVVPGGDLFMYFVVRCSKLPAEAGQTARIGNKNQAASNERTLRVFVIFTRV